LPLKPSFFTNQRFEDVRNQSLDVAKFVCAILVVTIHIWSREGLLYYIPNGIARIAVPFYFITSGYLLIDKFSDRFSSIRSYILKYFIVYIFWSAVFLLITYREPVGNINSYKDFFKYIHRFIVSGSYIHLWFFPALIYSLLIYLIVHKLKLNIYVILLVSLLFYTLGCLTDTYGFFVNQQYYLIYQLLFFTTRNALFFGFPFFLIGTLIKKNIFSIEKQRLLQIIVLFFILLIIEVFLYQPMVWQHADMRFSLIVLVPAMFLYVVQHLQSVKFPSYIVKIASFNFSIYLLHMVFYEFISYFLVLHWLYLFFFCVIFSLIFALTIKFLFPVKIRFIFGK